LPYGREVFKGLRIAIPTPACQALLLVASLPGCLDWGSLQVGRCGDGFIGPEERCDDGNQSGGDGCSADCQLELDGGTSLDAGSAPEGGEAGPPPAPLCGNGRLDADEVCDDGNESNADACLNGCSLATCGDGQLRAGVEECDVTSAMCTTACLACGGPGSYFRPGTEHCFTAHAEAVTFSAARAMCQAEGGELWTLGAKNEGDDVVTKLALTGPHWLGLLTTPSGNSWVTGEAVKYLNFALDEPKPATRCVVLTPGGENLWSSSSCGSAHSFVCERRAPTVGPGNHAYSVHSGAVTRDVARQLCAAAGRTLVALETDEERLLVGTLIDLRTWVDASEPSEGRFAWPNGSPVDASAFRAGQPDDADGSESCLALDPQKRLSDERCDQLNAFVCEHD
jgi:cysteine-rich repeat protein